MIFLKSAGAVVGWGIQFQQPLFLAVLTLILVLFAGNLFGLFEIPLPSWAGGIAQGSDNPHHGNSIAGAFAAGAFATLLATPCSAPFLGTAVGFAFSRGPVEILLIFAMLGLGLAAELINKGQKEAMAKYSKDAHKKLMSEQFDIEKIAEKGSGYEKLDQMLFDLFTGIRGK